MKCNHGILEALTCNCLLTDVENVRKRVFEALPQRVLLESYDVPQRKGA